ncbi:nucleotide sugar dehydrogenase [Stappia sp. MMSF_3263]|uniref:nucleotide sugar dehydrogenase n=1 Tax=Stappia sp. MMSF_3263 TaxID=3046693 RepID=UPI00273E9AEC|nr:nucleotide sugar dehydrogenase [Stappia sp. MMSF_3263]
MTAPQALTDLRQRLDDRTAVIGVIGLGYVGLPLALRFSELGHAVIGFDVDTAKIAELNADRGFRRYVGKTREEVRFASAFEATDDFSRSAECDALIICVPTPLGRFHDPDIGYILDAARRIRPHLRPGQVVALESTTYPGTTEDDMLPEMARDDLVVGKDIFVVYSPEREDPGNASFGIRQIPKVVSGVTQNCLAAAQALYGGAVDTLVPVASTRVAEMTKLLENIHRAVNIGLVNEMKTLADRMGIDIFDVIRAAATKPFGFTAFYPGPGVGGHCIPVDPFYLTWKAREYGLHTRFIELAGEINRYMPDFIVEKLMDALNGHRKALNGSRVLVLGAAFKKNIDDIRESPSLMVMDGIAKRGGVLSYADPFVPALTLDGGTRLESVLADEATVAAQDAVIIATDHDAFDYEMIARVAPLIVDTRGRYPASDPKVTRA